MTTVCLYFCLSYYSRKLRLLCAVILQSSVACLALPSFLTLSDTAHDFRKKIIEYELCVFFILCHFCLKHFSS